MIQKPRLISVRVPYRDYELLAQEAKRVDPSKKKGFSRSAVFAGLCKSILVGIQRPDRYHFTEMVFLMCHAAVRPEDEEGHQIIDKLFKQ